jgi:hypothetical protein
MDLVSDASQGQAKVPLRNNIRRFALPIFFIVLPCFAAATLFLGDPQRFEDLIRHLGIQVFDKPQPPPMIVEPVVAFTPPPAQPVEIPVRLIEAPEPEVAAQFLRMWRVSGPTVCKALRDAGIETSEWRAPSMRSASHECYFQRIYKKNDVRPLNSVFLRVKGNASGDIVEIRGRLVGPPTDAEGRLDVGHMKIFETLVRQAGWSDFQDALAPIRSLRDFENERFGAYFSFRRDTESQDSYNFMLVVAAGSGPQTRTKAYFSPERWVEAPDPRIAELSLPISQLASKQGVYRPQGMASR